MGVTRQLLQRARKGERHPKNVEVGPGFKKIEEVKCKKGLPPEKHITLIQSWGGVTKVTFERIPIDS
jgi:hypothetical protein